MRLQGKRTLLVHNDLSGVLGLLGLDVVAVLALVAIGTIKYLTVTLGADPGDDVNLLTIARCQLRVVIRLVWTRVCRVDPVNDDRRSALKVDRVLGVVGTWTGRPGMLSGACCQSCLPTSLSALNTILVLLVSSRDACVCRLEFRATSACFASRGRAGTPLHLRLPISLNRVIFRWVARQW